MKNRKSSGRKRASKSSKKVGAYVAYSQEQRFPMRDAKRSRRVKNSERIATIAGSLAFDASQRFTVNPGLAETFPWLSGQAAEWQQYVFHSLTFRYVSRTSTNRVGSIIISPDYNARESPPTSEAEASNTQDSVEDVIWNGLECHLDKASMFPLGPRKQIRTGIITGDMTVYDAARVFVCTVGETTTDDIGVLWVDYDVELFVPQSTPSPTYPVSTMLVTQDSQSVASTVDELLLDSPVEVYNPYSIPLVGGVFTLPKGVWKSSISFIIQDGTDEVCVVSFSALRDGVLVPGTNRNFKQTGNSSTTTSGADNFCIVVSDGTTTLGWNVNFIAAAGTLAARQIICTVEPC